MIKSDIKNGILNFNISENNLMYVKKENRTLFVEGKKINEGVDYQEYFLLDKPLYSIKGLTYYGYEKLIDGFFIGKSTNINNLTIVLMTESELDSKNKYDVISNYSIFDIKSKEKKFLNRLNNIVYCINELEYVILGSKTKIYAYSLPTAYPLWQFDLVQLAPPYQKQHSKPEDPLEVANFIGVLGNQIWVALNHYTLIALDVLSGRLVHQLSHISGFDYSYGSIIPEPKAIHIDHKRNKLVALAWEYYWEVDPETGHISMYPLNDYFAALRLRNDLPLHTVFLEEEGQLFFVSRNNRLNTDSQLACFNILTKKIVWQYKFQPNEQGNIPQPNCLKGNGQKMAVLDMNQTLFIFERESS